jgi:hypothetical protein
MLMESLEFLTNGFCFLPVNKRRSFLGSWQECRIFGRALGQGKNTVRALEIKDGGERLSRDVSLGVCFFVSVFFPLEFGEKTRGASVLGHGCFWLLFPYPSLTLAKN